MFDWEENLANYYDNKRRPIDPIRLMFCMIEHLMPFSSAVEQLTKHFKSLLLLTVVISAKWEDLCINRSTHLKIINSFVANSFIRLTVYLLLFRLFAAQIFGVMIVQIEIDCDNMHIYIDVNWIICTEREKNPHF